MSLLAGHGEALSTFLRKASGAVQVEIAECARLSGGAIQENWRLRLHFTGGSLPGVVDVVLRCDAPSAVAVSHGRAQEFALLQAAFAAGVTVPEPLWLGDREVLGRDFFIMRLAAGVAAGHRVVRDLSLGGDRVQLAERMGKEMARLHRLLPPQPTLAFIPVPEKPPALQAIDDYRHFLDEHHTAYPVLEWALRWLERHVPDRQQMVLCHRDWRTGNYMVDESGLTAILDWEFAGWSDPLEDIGWFCARCWRFGETGKEAGGIGPRDALYRGYERVSGEPVDHHAVYFWEVMAHVRWAVIAIQQGERHASGRERSLELALTTHIVPELELTLLHMTGASHA